MKLTTERTGTIQEVKKKKNTEKKKKNTLHKVSEHFIGIKRRSGNLTVDNRMDK